MNRHQTHTKWHWHWIWMPLIQCNNVWWWCVCVFLRKHFFEWQKHIRLHIAAGCVFSWTRKVGAYNIVAAHSCQCVCLDTSTFSHYTNTKDEQATHSKDSTKSVRKRNRSFYAFNTKRWTESLRWFFGLFANFHFVSKDNLLFILCAAALEKLQYHCNSDHEQLIFHVLKWHFSFRFISSSGRKLNKQKE